MEPLRRQIEERIESEGRGYAFTRKDFRDLGATGSVGKILSRLVEDGMIRRVARGLFDYPRVNPALGGHLSPDIDQVAQAVARKFRWKVIPEGALAANQLGLSQQVPAKIVYLSNGPTKKTQVGKRAIHFKHARPKELAVETHTSALIVQALRYMGREGVDSNAIEHLRQRLSADEKAALLKDTRYGTDWICRVAQQVAGS